MVTVRQSYNGGMSAWFEANVSKISREAADAVEDAVDKGKEVMRYHIETRGTAKSGKRGRVETGNMRDKVQSRMEKVTPREVSGRFGWLDPELYFQLQERGFNHVGGGQVEGMYALTDAFEETTADLLPELRRIVDGA